MQTAFNKGLWSPKLQNRFDVDSYRTACSKLNNFNILPQGGLSRRGGSVFLLQCYDSTKKSLLIPLQLDKDTVFIIEFSGNEKMRIMQFNPNTYTLTVKQDNFDTGFTDAELDEVCWVQINKKIYVTHKNHAPRKLSRVSDTSWLWTAVAHYPPAQRENRYSFNSVLTLDSASGNDVGFTTSVYAWMKRGDIGRFFVARDDKGKAGYAVLTEYLTATTGKCNIIEPFNDLTLTNNEWWLQGTGGGTINPAKLGPEGRLNKLVADKIEGADDHYFKEMDVGRYIEVNGGFVEIVKYKTHTEVESVIIKCLNDELGTRDFIMVQGEWGASERHPKTIGFYENRLFYGGTIEKPATVWGSRSQYYNDFTSHADDEYMLQYLLCSSVLHEILWMVGAQVLVIGTTNGIWTIGREDTSAVLTPTTPMLGYQSTLSCAGIRPATIGNILFFAQRNKKILRSFVASSGIGIDKATPTNETVFADPFDSSAISQIVVQSNPYVIVWTVDEAGNLWGLNYIEEQEINSWFRVKTDGLYESLMVYPQENDSDLLWTTTKRTIDGVTKRYIECFTSSVSSDSTKQFTAGGATTTLTGYTHLKGKDVWVSTAEQGYLRNSDETVHEFTVSGTGEIDIVGWTATVNAWAGLPYTSEAKTMNWHGGVEDYSYEKSRRLTKIRATVLNIYNGEVGIQVEENTTPTYVKLLDSMPGSAFTGVLEVGVGPGTGKIMKLCVRQADPADLIITGLGCNLK